MCDDALALMTPAVGESILVTTQALRDMGRPTGCGRSASSAARPGRVGAACHGQAIARRQCDSIATSPGGKMGHRRRDCGVCGDIRVVPPLRQRSRADPVQRLRTMVNGWCTTLRLQQRAGDVGSLPRHLGAHGEHAFHLALHADTVLVANNRARHGRAGGGQAAYAARFEEGARRCRAVELVLCRCAAERAPAESQLGR